MLIRFDFYLVPETVINLKVQTWGKIKGKIRFNFN
jgi:hypothetical protein